MYGMVREIFKEAHSGQGSSFDHGEADTSHMTESTQTMASEKNFKVKQEAVVKAQPRRTLQNIS